MFERPSSALTQNLWNCGFTITGVKYCSLGWMDNKKDILNGRNFWKKIFFLSIWSTVTTQKNTQSTHQQVHSYHINRYTVTTPPGTQSPRHPVHSHNTTRYTVTTPPGTLSPHHQVYSHHTTGYTVTKPTVQCNVVRSEWRRQWRVYVLFLTTSYLAMDLYNLWKILRVDTLF